MNDTRKHILTISLSLFLQKSYRDVTMQEIVNKSGLSKGAFYHYFKSKEDLFREIAGMFMSMGAVNYSKFDKSSLKVFYKQYIDHVSGSLLEINRMFKSTGNRPAEFNVFLILFEAISRFPEFLEQELKLHRQDVHAWKQVIAVAKKSGEIKSKSTDTEIADLFLYCTDGVFLRFVNNDTNTGFREFLTKAYDTIYMNLKS